MIVVRFSPHHAEEEIAMPDTLKPGQPKDAKSAQDKDHPDTKSGQQSKPSDAGKGQQDRR